MFRRVRSKRVQSETFRHFKKLLLVTFIVFLLLWATLVIVTHLKRVPIERVVLSAPTLTAYDLQETIHTVINRCGFLICKNNYALFPKRKLEQVLMVTWPRIKSVEIVLDDPQRAFITIQEHVPQFMVCHQQELEITGDEITDENDETTEPEVPIETSITCAYSNSVGEIYDEAPLVSRGVYLTYISPETYDADTYVRYHQFATAISETYDLSITELYFDNQNVHFGVESWQGHYIDSGYIIFDFEELSTIEGAQHAIDRLGLALTKTDVTKRIAEGTEIFRYLDVRFDDRFFVKFDTLNI